MLFFCHGRTGRIFSGVKVPSRARGGPLPLVQTSSSSDTHGKRIQRRKLELERISNDVTVE